MNVFDFACIGDSLTSGWSQDIGLRQWKNEVASRLSVGLPVPCVPYDVGAAGQTSAWFVTNAWRAAALRPAAILIAFGMNDAATGSGISLAQFKANISAGIATIKAASPLSRLFVMTMNPTIGDSAVTIPDPNSYYEKLREISAEDQDVELIDNFPLWGSPTSVQFPLNGAHPSLAAMRPAVIPNIVSKLASVMVESG